MRLSWLEDPSRQPVELIAQPIQATAAYAHPRAHAHPHANPHARAKPRDGHAIRRPVVLAQTIQLDRAATP